VLYGVVVAWIRRVRTASGATAVQIAESVGGRRRIVAHVGSAHTEAELGVLVERARGLLEAPGQGELELGVEPVAARVELLAGVDPAPAVLFDVAVEPARGRSTVTGPRVVGTASRVLYDTLVSVFTSLGFDVLQDEVFRDLVIARLVEPTSILDTGRVLTDLGATPASEKTMRRTLLRAQRDGYRDQLAALCFAHARAANGPKAAAFPQAMVVALAECGTHAIVGASIGGCLGDERSLAAPLLDACEPGMLLMADRAFYGFGLWRRREPVTISV